MSYRANLIKSAPKAFSHHRHDQINDRNLSGYTTVFCVFIACLVLNTIVAAKIINLGGYYLPASVFIWAFTFPCTDIVAEVYGRDYAKKMVSGGLLAFIITIAVVQLTVALPHAPEWPHQSAYESVFRTNARVMLGAVTSYIFVQYADVYIFSWVREKTKGKHLWLRNNVSTFGSQTLSNMIFLSIAFLGAIPMDAWWNLFLSNLIYRWLLAFVDTPIVYGAVYALRRIYPELK